MLKKQNATLTESPNFLLFFVGNLASCCSRNIFLDFHGCECNQLFKNASAVAMSPA